MEEDEIPEKNNRFFENFKESLRKLTSDDNPDHYIYCGGDHGRHLNYWRIFRENHKIDPPTFSDTCLCGHYPIHNQCYLQHEGSGKIIACGNCCIKRFIPPEKRNRTCEICKCPHKNRKDNLCSECREEWHKCIKCEKLCDIHYSACFVCRLAPCEGGCGQMTDLGVKCNTCRNKPCKVCKNNTSNSSGFCTNCENTVKRKCKTCEINKHFLKWKCCYYCYVDKT
jgi:hypothetical protein